MFRSPQSVLLTVAFALALGACSSKGSSVGSTGSTCPTTQTLTYANFGKAFIESHCNSCHAGKERPSLTSIASIRAAARSIDEQAAAGPNGENTLMPEDGSVSTADRKKLGEWLACGAPE